MPEIYEVLTPLWPERGLSQSGHDASHIGSIRREDASSEFP
jgi:hypothetical protein